MLHPEQVEELICLVSSLDRPALTRHFTEFRATFPLNFSPEFLATTDIERLRHIFVALCLQSQQMPSAECAEAA